MNALLLILMFSLNAFAELDKNVLVRGKIGSSFDNSKVLIKDSLGQKYFLPRHVFPAKFEFKQGKDFTLEIPEAEVSKIKLIKEQ